MKKFFIRLWTQTEGQDLVEYALIVATIGLGLISVVGQVATALNTVYASISAMLGTLGTGTP